MLNPDYKEFAVKQARDMFAQLYYGKMETSGQTAIFMAECLRRVMVRDGHTALVMAGSAAFQVSGDASGPFFLEYRFRHRHAAAAVAAGQLPEMHAWVTMFIKGGAFELADLTTGAQAELIRIEYEVDWQEDFKLPSFLWCTPEELKAYKVAYVHSNAASEMARALVLEFDKHNNIQP